MGGSAPATEPMRAVVVREAASNARIEAAEAGRPSVGDGQVLIECHYGALNWADTMIARGVYPGQIAEPPYVPRENIVLGAELSGRIVATGPGVDGFEPNQVVSALTPALTGAFADYVVTDAALVTGLPLAVPTAQAAAFRGVGLTAYHLLFSAFDLKPGHRVLVHSVSGGVGLAVTQLAIEVGATVLGTASSSLKAKIAHSHGASKVFVRGEEDFVEGVLEHTRGRGVDLVIDSLGGDVLLKSIDALAVLGRVINIGNTGDGGWPGSALELHRRLYSRCASYMAFDVFRAAPPNSKRWKQGIDYLVQRFADGRFAIPVAREFSFDECGEMIESMRSGTQTGKLCLALR